MKKRECGCSPLCSPCERAMRGLVVALRKVLAEEEMVRRQKRDLYNEARGLGLPVSLLKRRSGADVTLSGPASVPRGGKVKL